MTTGSSAAITALHPEVVAAAQAVIPPDGVLDLVTQMYGALADPTRARILYALTTGELCVRDLAVVCGVSESAVSHQMRLLRDRRLVRSRRAGTTICPSCFAKPNTMRITSDRRWRIIPIRSHSARGAI
jgi:DNA-binding transcriptional ArsR family regulator